MKSSETRLRLDPRPPHSEIFNSGGEILPPDALLSTSALIARKNNQTNTMAYDLHGIGNFMENSILEPLIPVDLFGSKISDKPYALAVSVDRCADCGSSFERAHRMGRPVRFCSNECRRTHAANQRREWNAAPPPSPVSACRRCGHPLEIRKSGPGRARQYCSRRCLLGADNHPDEAGDLFDLAGDNRSSE